LPHSDINKNILPNEEIRGNFLRARALNLLGSSIEGKSSDIDGIKLISTKLNKAFSMGNLVFYFLFFSLLQLVNGGGAIMINHSFYSLWLY
jgi:hypothetical protein